MNLIKISTIYFVDFIPRISITQGYTEIGEEQFIAVGFEKSKVATNWEDTDRFNIIVLTKACDQKYYIAKIEHPADVLSPKYIEDEMNVHWVEENIQPSNKELLGNLYSLNDSRSEYTLTISDKPYLFYEKYLCYLMSVSYEIYENYYNGSEVSPFLWIRCQLSSRYFASALDYLPMKTLEYSINIRSLLQTSIFQYCPFGVWDGNVIINGRKVTLESKQI